MFKSHHIKRRRSSYIPHCPANVIWYDKNSNPINWSKSKRKRMVLGSVTKNADSATYTCKAQS